MLRTLSRYLEDDDERVVEQPTRTLVEPPTIAVAASIVALGFLGSRLLGLVRTMAIAWQHGTSPDLDAYFVAFLIPDLIFQLLAGATLGSAFIPTFARMFGERGERDAWRLASNVLNLVFAATLACAIVGLLLAPLIVPVIAPGLGDDTGQETELTNLAVDLTRIMLISPVLFAVSGMFMGILNGRHHFLGPALAPMFYNLAIIAGALISDDVRVLAFAVVIGALLHLLVQIPALVSVGMRWTPTWDWRDAAVRTVGKLMGPRVLGIGAYQFNLIIGAFFASTLASGAISSLAYAWLIVMMPLGLFGMAISTAAFPRLAEEATRDEESLRSLLSRSLRLILFLTIPASVGLMVLAKPLVAFLLRGGAFDVSSQDLVVGALICYSLALFAHSGIEIMSRGFYAVSDTMTPVTFAVVSMVINLFLAFILVIPFELNGIALALSIATVVEFALLLRALIARMGGLEGGRIVFSVSRAVLATLLMAEVVGLWLILVLGTGLLDLDSRLQAGIALVTGTALGAGVFYFASRALGSEEATEIVGRLPIPERVRALIPG